MFLNVSSSPIVVRQVVTLCAVGLQCQCCPLADLAPSCSLSVFRRSESLPLSHAKST